MPNTRFNRSAQLIATCRGVGGWQLQFLVNEGNGTLSDRTAKYLP
jgi:hypothetical protein